jgi:hypothetical protein
MTTEIERIKQHARTKEDAMNVKYNDLINHCFKLQERIDELEKPIVFRRGEEENE